MAQVSSRHSVSNSICVAVSTFLHKSLKNKIKSDSPTNRFELLTCAGGESGGVYICIFNTMT